MCSTRAVFGADRLELRLLSQLMLVLCVNDLDIWEFGTEPGKGGSGWVT